MIYERGHSIDYVLFFIIQERTCFMLYRKGEFYGGTILCN